MSYDRFSSWGSDEQPQEKEEPKEEPKVESFSDSLEVNLETDDPDQVLESILAIESGEEISVEVSISSFNAIFKSLKRNPSITFSYDKSSGILNCQMR